MTEIQNIFQRALYRKILMTRLKTSRIFLSCRHKRKVIYLQICLISLILRQSIDLVCQMLMLRAAMSYFSLKNLKFKVSLRCLKKRQISLRKTESSLRILTSHSMRRSLRFVMTKNHSSKLPCLNLTIIKVSMEELTQMVFSKMSSQAPQTNF